MKILEDTADHPQRGFDTPLSNFKSGDDKRVVMFPVAQSDFEIKTAEINTVKVSDRKSKKPRYKKPVILEDNPQPVF